MAIKEHIQEIVKTSKDILGLKLLNMAVSLMSDDNLTKQAICLGSKAVLQEINQPKTVFEYLVKNKTGSVEDLAKFLALITTNPKMFEPTVFEREELFKKRLAEKI